MIIHAIIVGIIAWVFVFILIEPDMIFFKWNKVLDRLPLWLHKPLGRCEYCLAGQLALWYYLIHECLDGTYNVIMHIAFISIAIFTVRIINKYIYGT